MPPERHRVRSLRRAIGALATAMVVILVFASQATAAGPTVTINQAAGQSDPTSGSPIEFTATFSTAVTGFTGTDVDLSASTAGGTLVATVSGGATVYTIKVTGMTTAGVVVASIPAGVAQGSGGSNSASMSTDNSVTYELRPTVTINQAAGQFDPTSGSTIEFTATFSAPVFGFTASDVSLSGSTAGDTLDPVVSGAGGSTTYTVVISGMTTAGVVIASIPAGAAEGASGAQSLASTSTDHTVSWAPETTSPTATINQAAGQADPTSSPTIEFTATFSTAVVGFTAADVSLAGSTATGNLILQVTGGPTVYTVTVAGMSGAGTVVASIPAGAAQGSGGHQSQASTSTDDSVSWAPASAGGGSSGSGGGGTTPPTGKSSTGSPSLQLLTRCSAKHPCPTDAKGKVLPLRVSCGAVAPCTGQAGLVLGHKSLGKLKLKLAAGATAKLRMPLSASATRLLASRPKIAAKLQVELGSSSAVYPVTFALP
ncbi:MAG TPA: hypothetical protein VMH33_07530 [Solirubrobacterales bacterium]|nr:hypothetical protein [Solirubrobacterales bacterium]